MNGALHEAVAFETAQGLRQHFLRNPADLALERGVTHRAASEDLNNERGPFIGNAIEHKPRWTLRIHHRGVGGNFSHPFLVERSAPRSKGRVTYIIGCMAKIDM